MRNSLKMGALALITCLGMISCQESDNVIDTVLETTQQGAVLRTLEVVSGTMNSSLPDSEFAVMVEEQDNQGGNLLEQVNLYVTIDDNTPANGTTAGVKTLVKSFMPSDFTPGPFGLPRATLSTTFGESAAALGLTFADYAPGDIFVVDLELLLTDGRVFDNSSASGSTSGGFYSSPFRYSVPLVCSPAPGVYTVNMVDSYGDGWQTTSSGGGEGLTIDVDGTILMVGMCSPYGSAGGSFLESGAGTGCTENAGSAATGTITIPAGAVSAEWTFPGDFWGEIGFDIIAPDGTTVLFSGAPGSVAPGIVPVVFCAM